MAGQDSLHELVALRSGSSFDSNGGTDSIDTQRQTLRVAVLTRAQSMKKPPPAGSSWNTLQAKPPVGGEPGITSRDPGTSQTTQVGNSNDDPLVHTAAVKHPEASQAEGTSPLDSSEQVLLEGLLRELQSQEPFIAQRKWTIFPNNIVTGTRPYNGIWTVDAKGLARLDGRI